MELETRRDEDAWEHRRFIALQKMEHRRIIALQRSIQWIKRTNLLIEDLTTILRSYFHINIKRTLTDSNQWKQRAGKDVSAFL